MDQYNNLKGQVSQLHDGTLTAVCTDLGKKKVKKRTPDKSNLWYTESKAKFTQALQMVYTDTSSASLDFAWFSANSCIVLGTNFLTVRARLNYANIFHKRNIITIICHLYNTLNLYAYLDFTIFLQNLLVLPFL